MRMQQIAAALGELARVSDGARRVSAAKSQRIGVSATMSHQVFTIEEILAVLQAIGAAKGTIDNFRRQAEFVHAHKPTRAAEYDDVQVNSGYGAKTKRGHVDLTVNDQRVQMEPKKAREIGLMLLECAESATSDEIFLALMQRIGIDDEHRLQVILLDLREIRQGSRGVVYPT